MAKSKTAKSLLTKESYSFLQNYINNPSPTGFETSGQKNVDGLYKALY